MWRLSVGLAAVMWLGGAALCGDIVAGPDPGLSPERVVEIQLDALQHNDNPHKDAGIARTWAFAHPDNKLVTGPLQRFTEMIKSPGYRPLVDHRAHSVQRVVVTRKTALFAVTVVPAKGPVVFYQWKLEKVKSGSLAGDWMTVAVSPPLQQGDSI